MTKCQSIFRLVRAEPLKLIEMSVAVRKFCT